MSMPILTDECILNLIEHPPAACVCPGWHSTYATFKPAACQLCDHLLLKRHFKCLQTICYSLALVTCPAEKLQVGLDAASLGQCRRRSACKVSNHRRQTKS